MAETILQDGRDGGRQGRKGTQRGRLSRSVQWEPWYEDEDALRDAGAEEEEPSHLSSQVFAMAKGSAVTVRDTVTPQALQDLSTE